MPIPIVPSDPRKRRVFRVAGSWALCGWIAVEVSATVAPLLGLPEWIPTAIVLLVLVGFPFVVGLSWAFEVTPNGLRRSRPEPGATSLRNAAPVAVMTAGALVLAIATTWWVLRAPAAPDDGTGLVADRVAIVPFRVSGPEEIGYLGEGMMDLLAAKLGGESGPRAVDPGTLMGALGATEGDLARGLPEDSLVSLGRRLGAGRVLTGSVVGSAENLIVSARLLDVATGREVGRTSVEGPEADLQALTDRLAGGVLVLGAGEEAQRLAALTTTSLPALRRYLRGQSLLRRGDFEAAEDEFVRALEADSTFALAAIGAYHASTFTVSARGDLLVTAWRFRDRLGERDLALLSALLGPDYPEPSSYRAAIEAWGRAAELLPDRVDVWYNYGDDLLHWGRAARVPEAWRRATAYFDRALRIDSTYASAMVHRISLAMVDEDVELVRRLADRYLREHAESDAAAFVEWALAATVGDTATLRTLWESAPTWPSVRLVYIVVDSYYSRIAAANAWPALEELAGRSGGGQARRTEMLLAYGSALDYGRPAQAAGWLEELVRQDPDALPAAAAYEVLGALHAGADPARADEAARALERIVSETETVGEADEATRCVLDRWRLESRGEALEAVLDRYRGRDADERLGATGELCLALLHAVGAIRGGRPDAAERVAALETYLAEGPRVSATRMNAAYLTLARLWRELGKPERALEAARARAGGVPNMTFNAALLREQGELAAELGRTEEAIGALRHYLAFRQAPEEAVRTEVEEARALLDRLMAVGP